MELSVKKTKFPHSVIRNQIWSFLSFLFKVNLSAPRPEGRGLLKVSPEPRFPIPPLKAGLRAVERVKTRFKLSSIKTVLSHASQNCLDKEDCIFDHR